MINNEEPKKNTELTLEQLEQINVTQHRLIVLETEIVTASKSLRVVKSELEKTLKDKSYQEELLATLTTQTEELKLTYQGLNDSYKTLSDKVDSINQEIATKTASNLANEKELKSKKDELDVRETELLKKQEVFSKLEKDNQKAFDVFAENVIKLKEVISTF